TSHSKVEETGKKVNGLDLLLEAEKYKIQQLKEQMSTLEKKCVDYTMARYLKWHQNLRHSRQELQAQSFITNGR
ncbi:hypothetical protein Ddye_012353, partial [Dipteronia dyeriana]